MNFVENLKRSYLFLIITIFLTYLSYHFLDMSFAEYFCNIQAKTFLKILSEPLEPVLLPFYLLVLLKLYEKYPQKIQTLIQVGFVVLINTVVVTTLKIVFGRPRPEVFMKSQIVGFHFFDIKNHYVSFPSGHAATAGLISGCIYQLFQKKNKFWLMIPLLLSFTRVLLCKHYLSDVIFGFGIGFFLVLFIGLKKDSLFEKTLNFIRKYARF